MERHEPSTRRHTATHCNALQHTATFATRCNTEACHEHQTPICQATHRNTLQHTATHCNAYEGGVFHESASDPAYIMYAKQTQR